MSYLRQLWVVLLGSLLLTSVAIAQVDRGTVTGTVTDQSGAVIPDVAITVTNVATGISNNAVTSAAGIYVVPLLPPGTYRLTAEKQGFKKFTQTNILVTVGDTTRADVGMTVGSKTETVTVTGEAPLLDRRNFRYGILGHQPRSRGSSPGRRGRPTESRLLHAVGAGRNRTRQ